MEEKEKEITLCMEVCPVKQNTKLCCHCCTDYRSCSDACSMDVDYCAFKKENGAEIYD